MLAQLLVRWFSIFTSPSSAESKKKSAPGEVGAGGGSEYRDNAPPHHSQAESASAHSAAYPAPPGKQRNRRSSGCEGLPRWGSCLFAPLLFCVGAHFQISIPRFLKHTSTPRGSTLFPPVPQPTVPERICEHRILCSEFKCEETEFKIQEGEGMEQGQPAWECEASADANSSIQHEEQVFLQSPGRRLLNIVGKSSAEK